MLSLQIVSILAAHQSTTDSAQQIGSTKTEQQSSIPHQTTADGAVYAVSTKTDPQSSVPHQTAAGGAVYAVSSKTATKDNHASNDKKNDSEVCECMILFNNFMKHFKKMRPIII